MVDINLLKFDFGKVDAEFLLGMPFENDDDCKLCRENLAFAFGMLLE